MNNNVNRVTNAIALITARVDTLKAKGTLTDESIAQKSKGLDMSMEEFCHFQNLKSALMGSKITEDEAQTVYGILGTTPDHFNSQPYVIKIVITKMYAELMGIR
jgi:hypothetical protein